MNKNHFEKKTNRNSLRRKLLILMCNDLTRDYLAFTKREIGCASVD